MKSIISVICFMFVLTSFSHAQNDTTKKRSMPTRVVSAVAIISGSTPEGITGTIRFIRLKKGVRITGEIYGLTPGKHGFHIHETGACDRPDFTTAGPHFNPDAHKHGDMTTDMSHAGDYGNIVANDYGVAKFSFVDKNASFKGKYSIIGRSVIVHEKEDDLKTDPSGNSGARIGCGIIQLNTYRRH